MLCTNKGAPETLVKWYPGLNTITKTVPHLTNSTHNDSDGVGEYKSVTAGMASGGLWMDYNGEGVAINNFSSSSIPTLAAPAGTWVHTNSYCTDRRDKSSRVTTSSTLLALASS